MAIYNPQTKTTSEINADLERREMEFYQRDDANARSDRQLSEAIDSGIKKIEEMQSRFDLFD